nr:hypothetical protein [Tanacetum cinerariifolium]
MSFSKSTRIAALSPFHNVRAVAHEFNSEVGKKFRTFFISPTLSPYWVGPFPIRPHIQGISALLLPICEAPSYGSSDYRYRLLGGRKVATRMHAMKDKVKSDTSTIYSEVCRNPTQAGFRVIPDYKALAIARVGHGYHLKDLSQILKRSYFYPSIVATAQPSPHFALGRSQASPECDFYGGSRKGHSGVPSECSLVTRERSMSITGVSVYCDPTSKLEGPSPQRRSFLTSLLG